MNKTGRIFIGMATLVALVGCSQFTPSTSTASEDKQRGQVITGKFTPSNGQTIMFVGQDSETIADYITQVPEDNIEGVTLYTQLKSANPDETLKGVFSVGNWNSGDVYFAQTLSQVPSAALAIGLAFDACGQVDHASNIASGVYDKSLEVLAKYLKSLAPRKVLLRAGYEFDGMWNCYEPESHKQAFRKIAQAMQHYQADNVAMVWQSAAWPAHEFAGERAHLYDHNDEDHINKWYPGDDVVDWVSISTFYRDTSQFNFELSITPAAAQQLYLDFARERNKPVFIAESAPQGYRTGALTHSYIAWNKQTPRTAEQIWQEWYQPYFDFIYDNRDVIRGVAYINTHWESQSRWYCAPNSKPPAKDCAEGNWGDSRVQANDYIKSRWLQEVNNANKWSQNSSY